jgi:hypothetical protein
MQKYSVKGMGPVKKGSSGIAVVTPPNPDTSTGNPNDPKKIPGRFSTPRV